MRYILLSLSLVFFISVQAIAGDEKTIELNQQNRWRAMGTAPMTVEYDKAEKAIRFQADFNNKKAFNTIYPLFCTKNGESFKNISAIRFDMKNIAEGGGGKVQKGLIILPKSKGISGSFKFKLPPKGKWGTVNVKLQRKGYDISRARNLQILVQSNAKKLICLVKNIVLLDVDGKVISKLYKGKKKIEFSVSSPFSLFVEPDKEATFSFTAGTLPEGTLFKYIFLDYDGNETDICGSVGVKAGYVTIKAELKPGFYELFFPKTGQRFGIVSAAEFTGKPDDFWGINTLFSVKKVSHKQSNDAFQNTKIMKDYFKILKRSGIRQVREMALIFHQIPKENTIPNYYGSGLLTGNIRNLASRYGIKVLTFYERFPGWTGTRWAESPAQTQVIRLDKLAKAYVKILKSEAPSASGVQVFNEGDAQWKHAPPDGTATLSWFTRYLLEKNTINTPVVGMAFCSRIFKPMIELYVKNGLLDIIDAFSINNYSSPESLVKVLISNINILAKCSKRIPPLWITECGKSWKRGTPRGKIADDKVSANWIARKAVAARAFGIDRYYAFCMPYFNENKNNFGLFDYYSTPQRNFAAYITVVSRLSGKKYIGDLAKIPDGARSAWVFSDGNKLTVVISSSNKIISLKGLPVKSVTGIDGSIVLLQADASVSVRGGLIYLEMNAKNAGTLINVNTIAMEKKELLQRRRSAPRRGAPVVLRHHFEDFQRSSIGYLTKKNKFPINVSAFNLSDKAITVALQLSVDDEPLPANIKNAEISPNSKQDFTWSIDMKGRSLADVRVIDKNGQSSPIVMRFICSLGKCRSIPGASEAANWRKNSSGKMTITNDKKENALKFTLVFSPDNRDRWAYPLYNLKRHHENLKDVNGIIFDIKADPVSAQKGFSYCGMYVVFEHTNSKQSPFVRKDSGPGSEWETRTVLLPARGVDSISIGLNPKAASCTFWVRNIRFF